MSVSLLRLSSVMIAICLTGQLVGKSSETIEMLQMFSVKRMVGLNGSVTSEHVCCAWNVAILVQSTQ